MGVVVPEGYKPALGVIETEKAIKEIHVYFEEALCRNLNLTRISAPLYVFPETGLNDNLNGVERPVTFDIAETGKTAEIVHSLAKWKRYALKKYGFKAGAGMYTIMNAIRRDEIADNIHSLYVDQWDWEKIIEKQQRNEETLKSVVRDIYAAMRETEQFICVRHRLPAKLPEDITFVKAQELEDEYPSLTPKEREHAAARKHGAVFIMQIGAPLKSGTPHDGRAPDYDDWSLNGDILVYFPLLDISLELSSMGIRVDEAAIKRQLEQSGKREMEKLPFQSAVLNAELPYTIGGGIGQSRLCMFMLNKAHIGEVQVSVWPEETERICTENGINLL